MMFMMWVLGREPAQLMIMMLGWWSLGPWKGAIAADSHDAGADICVKKGSS